jgi:mannose-1-phosphate guanylyltransferase
MYIVLMAGGVGARFWPRSREATPKQTLNIVGNKSMLQTTYDRIKSLTTNDKILVITNQEIKKSVHKHLPNLPKENIIAEPFGRNTAPCIALAGSIIQKRNDQDQVMVVLPADHLIHNQELFIKSVKEAAQYAAKNDCLVTMGIEPTYPETGYGYIQKDEKIENNIYRVRTFAEKPNKETAERFIESGDFFWNSGMFIWNTKVIMESFEEHLSDMSLEFKKLTPQIDSPNWQDKIGEVYSKIKSVSIDYGIMEVAQKVCVIEVKFRWNDMGSWEAVHRISDKDENGNTSTSQENVMVNSGGNYIYSAKKIVAAIDVNDLVVVETDDALLICKKESSQKVKEVVDLLKRKELTDYI